MDYRDNSYLDGMREAADIASIYPETLAAWNDEDETAANSISRDIMAVIEAETNRHSDFCNCEHCAPRKPFKQHAKWMLTIIREFMAERSEETTASVWAAELMEGFGK